MPFPGSPRIVPNFARRAGLSIAAVALALLPAGRD
jgi:hypothetical protein